MNISLLGLPWDRVLCFLGKVTPPFRYNAELDRTIQIAQKIGQETYSTNDTESMFARGQKPRQAFVCKLSLFCFVFGVMNTQLLPHDNFVSLL